MKRHINFNRLRVFLGLTCILLIGVYQQEINRPAAESKTESVFVNIPQNSALQTSSCGCKDKKEMLYRVRDIQAIIAEYQRQIPAFQAANTKFSHAAKANLKAVLQAVTDNTLATEPAPKPNLATAETDGHSCNITPNRPGTPCLAEAIQRHELHHSKVCTMNKPQTGKPASDYRDGTTMVAYAQEEIEAYTIEMRHLQAELGKLPDSCNTSNWYLSYQVQVRYQSPPSKSNYKETGKSWRTWDIDHTYSAEDIELSPTTAPPSPLALPDMTNMTTQQRIQAALTAVQNQANAPTQRIAPRKFWSHQPPVPYPSKYVPQDVIIKDKLVDFLYEECKGNPQDYIMTTETTKTWNGTGKDGTANKFGLEVDYITKTYNVTIPVLPMITFRPPVKPPVTVEEKTVIDQTILKPPHREITKPPQQWSFQNMGMVNVKGILENTEIHHGTDRPLVSQDLLTFDSGWVKAAAPLPPEWRDLEGKLEVKIYYRLTKLPAK